MTALSVVILAAGRGSRMRTTTPKVCLPVGGRPMLQRVMDTAVALNPQTLVVVVGDEAERIQKSVVTDFPVQWVHQRVPKGTGDAVLQALAVLPKHGQVLILFGDVPLVRPETCQALLAQSGDGLGILTAEYPDPTGLGRVVRDDQGALLRVVEHVDASPRERTIRECFTGMMAAPADFLASLASVGCNNQSQEVYLPDVVPLWAATGVVASHCLADVAEVQGANTQAQLAALEAAYQVQARLALMASGVRMLDPSRVCIRGEVMAEADVVIDVDVVLQGRVILGAGSCVGPMSWVEDSTLGPGSTVGAHSVVRGTVLGPGATVGPFAHCRAGTVVGENAKVGAFVEMKKTTLGQGSKVPHLSYLGDATVGVGVNVGAGTITCNYDGLRKHPTVIDDGAFVGAGCQLVAPIRVGAGATVGAGSCLRRDAPAGQLTLSASPQRTVSGWKRPSERADD